MLRDVDQLTGRTFDLLVVGGGIYGLTIAYDAAQRGLSVALDQGDGEATLGRVVRDRQAVDAAADHEQVEGAAGELVDVAEHQRETRLYYLRGDDRRSAD